MIMDERNSEYYDILLEFIQEKSLSPLVHTHLVAGIIHYLGHNDPAEHSNMIKLCLKVTSEDKDDAEISRRYTLWPN